MYPAILLYALLGLTADMPKPIEVKAPQRSSPVGFAKDVSEVLDAKCAGCHGATLAENKLDMETVAGMLKGGKRGPAIVPGKADESLLFRMAAHRADPVMPPKEKKDLKPLTPEELGLLKAWIDAGAKDDSDASPVQPKPVEIGVLPPGVHPINALDLTPDGRRVASGRANVVEVLDVDSGLPILSLGGHRDLIQSVRFSPDGKRLAAGSFQVVTLWDVPSGTLERTFSGTPEAIDTLVATRDGKTLISSGPEKAIRFWNAADGKTFRNVSVPSGTKALALSPQETLLAGAGADNIVRILNVADGKEAHALKGHAGAVTSVAWLPDGKSVVTAGLDGTARAWTLPSKPGDPVEMRTIDVGPKAPVPALVVLPDGTALLTAGADATARLIDLGTGEEVRSFPLAGGPPNALAIDPDGRTLLVGSEDGSARLYELATGEPVSTFGPHAGPVRAVGFSPKGDRVLTAGADGGLKVWDRASGRGLIAFGHPAVKAGDASPPVQAALFLADGRIATAAEKTARTWTFEGGWSEARTFGPHISRVLAIDFSPDGKLMATGGGEPSRSGEVKVWDVATGRLGRSLDTLHSDTVFALRFSPDGTKLATASADKFLKVVNVGDGKELKSFEGHTHHVLAVDWSGDGKKLATGGADSAAKVWDFESGEAARTINGAAKGVTALRWVPGKPLLIGASGDAAVRAWNPDNGSVPRTFSGAGDYLYAVAASADGGRVAAGGADGVLLLWNGGNGQLLRKIPRDAPTAAK
jgi:WD40 repeat protein